MPKILLLTVLLAVLLLAACRPTLASAPPELAAQETVSPQVTPTPKFGASVDVDPGNWPKSDTKPPVLPPPFRSKPSATIEERMAWQKEMEDKGYISKTKRNVGPETTGSIITVRGVQIKLPDDAFILMDVQGPDRIQLERPLGGGKPWDTPYYVIMRNKSTININAANGNVQFENTATGEEASFEFLKRALQQ